MYRIHVLRRIDPKTAHPQIKQALQVCSDACLHVLCFYAKVGQVNQFTVLHLCAIAIIPDVVIGGKAAVVKVFVRPQVTIRIR